MAASSCRAPCSSSLHSHIFPSVHHRPNAASVVWPHALSHALRNVLAWSDPELRLVVLQVQYGTPELLEATTAECLAQVDAFDPPSAARLLHGYAMLQHRPPRLLGPLTRRCVGMMGEFGAHDLSLTVSSLGKLLCDPGKSVCVQHGSLASC